ncbi:hypothetical protein SFR_1817 [Streptomyces sp. FR-008]|nr:hypothetical protein SFR_1817 [Streptomyces sp. FR-008]
MGPPRVRRLVVHDGFGSSPAAEHGFPLLAGQA